MADLIRMKRTTPPLIRKVPARSVESYIAKGWACLDERPDHTPPEPEGEAPPEATTVAAGFPGLDPVLVALVDDRSLMALGSLRIFDAAALHAASDKDLLGVPYLTKKTLAKIRLAGK